MLLVLASEEEDLDLVEPAELQQAAESIARPDINRLINLYWLLTGLMRSIKGFE